MPLYYFLEVFINLEVLYQLLYIFRDHLSETRQDNKQKLNIVRKGTKFLSKGDAVI